MNSRDSEKQAGLMGGVSYRAFIIATIHKLDRAFEQDLRSYLKGHRTTRLDIELHVADEPMQFYQEFGKAGISLKRHYKIVQRLPVQFRPRLP